MEVIFWNFLTVIKSCLLYTSTWKLKEITAKLNQILTGYYHYYGITDNTERITAFRYHVDVYKRQVLRQRVLQSL